jgi:hypothetical protein
MVLSLAPAAFAAWPSTTASTKAVSNAKANIEYALGTLAADTAVFESIKTMDTMVTNMAKGFFDGIDKYDVTVNGTTYRLYNSDLVGNAKTFLRSEIGGSIMKYMNDHKGAWNKTKVTLTDPVWSQQINPATGKNYAATLVDTGVIDGAGSRIYMSKDVPGLYYGVTAGGAWYYKNATSAAEAANTGNWNGPIADAAKPQKSEEQQADPVKYIDTWAKAISDTFTSKKGAAAIERLYYDLALAKVQVDLQDKFDDLYDDIAAWQGSDNLLSEYGFHSNGNWNPYAFVNPDDLPKAHDSYVDVITSFDPLQTPIVP